MWGTPSRHPAPGRGCRVDALDKGPPQLKLGSHPHLQLVGFRVFVFVSPSLVGLSLFVAKTIRLDSGFELSKHEQCCVLLLPVRPASGPGRFTSYMASWVLAL